ncbi:MAG: ABC transporter permease [Gemmatimonadota bacterium]
MLEDLKYALRSLRRSPGFTTVVILTLALGIGANTAIFSLLYGVMFRPLPYPEPERLVGVVQVWDGQRSEQGVTYREFRYLADQSPVFSDIAASASVGLNLFSGGLASRISALRVSASYFPTLGIQPALGRNFLAEEDQPGAGGTVVLSHGLWQRRFGGDAAVIGRTVSLDGQPFVVVGVMPATFHPDADTELWTTLAQVARTIGNGQNLGLIARLKPGMTLASARAAERTVLTAFQAEFKPGMPKEASTDLESWRVLVAGDRQVPIQLLFGAIGLVLLIACANVANLVLGRGAARTRELAVRAAIGATRQRLLRQLMTESLVLSLAGGLLGLLLAVWSLDALLALVPEGLPRIGEIRIDGWALLFTLGLSVLTGLLFGAIPGWQSARGALHDSLREGSGRTTGTGAQGRLRHALVELEVAVSLILLVGAGLLTRTFANLVHTEPGFETGHVTSAEIWLTGSKYDSTIAIHNFYGELTRRIEAIPGVTSAAIVEAGLPLVRGGNVGATFNGDLEHHHSIDYRTVTEGFFGTLGVPLRQGRLLAATDGAGAPLVAVVNEAFVRKYLAQNPALGTEVDLEGSQMPRRVVGVVGDIRSFIGAPAQPTIFIPSAQTPAGLTRAFSSWFPTHLVVRTQGDPAALQGAIDRVVRAADPQVPVGRIRTMDQVLGASLAFERFLMLVLGLFAGLALLLAGVGIYGVISYLVTQRTREIGIRMALGATAGDVRRLVVGRGVRLTVVGIGAGLVGALVLTPLIASQLYAVKPLDPSTLGMVTAGVGLIALLACYLPAQKATRVDPVIALRAE